MTELEQYCRHILNTAKDKPTSVKVYGWSRGVILVVATDSGDRMQALNDIKTTKQESIAISGDGFIEYKKKSTSDLARHCLLLGDYAKISMRAGDIEVNGLLLDSEILWTLEEVILFQEQGYIEFGVYSKVWAPGDIVRDIHQMNYVTFSRFSHGGEFFFCNEFKGAQKTSRYNKLPGDQK